MEFETRWEHTIKIRLKELKDDIERKLVDPEMESEWILAAKHIVRDWRLGIGSPDGTGIFILEEEAYPEAKRIFTERTLENGMKAIYKNWDDAQKNRVSMIYLHLS